MGKATEGGSRSDDRSAAGSAEEVVAVGPLLDPAWAREILDELAEGLYVATPDHRLAFMNARLRTLVGTEHAGPCFHVLGGRTSPCSGCVLLDPARAAPSGHHRSCHWFELSGATFEATSVPLRANDGTVAFVGGVVRNVTNRERQEARIQATESRYRDLFEAVPEAILVMATDGRLVDCNRAILDLLGYGSRHEFLRIDPSVDLFVDPDDQLRFLSMMVCDGGVRDLEVAFRRKDGAAVTMALSGRARRKADVAVEYEVLGVDLTERKKLERRLRDQARFLANVIDASVDGIIFGDMSGRIRIFNRGAERIFGFSEEEAIGKMTVDQLYHPPEMAREVMRMIRAVNHGGTGRLDGLLVNTRRKDGSAVRCNLSAAIVRDDAGEEVGTVGILVDLTERLAMEDRLSEAREKLMQSEKLAAMGRLTSQIAHEINNPLYGILNTLELLRPLTETDHRRRRLIDITLSEGRRLGDLLRKMLVLSKPEQEPHQPIELNTLLSDLLLFVERQMREHGVRIEYGFDEKLPPVHASPAQFRQVFLNILQNARDAMPSGGTLTVTTAAVPAGAEVRVTDTGGGIRQEHMDRIFDAFFTTKDKAKGVGLGLSVCYSIVKDHGGDIRVESTPGKGATFIVTLPVGRISALPP